MLITLISNFHFLSQHFCNWINILTQPRWSYRFLSEILTKILFNSIYLSETVSANRDRLRQTRRQGLQCSHTPWENARTECGRRLRHPRHLHLSCLPLKDRHPRTCSAVAYNLREFVCNRTSPWYNPLCKTSRNSCSYLRIVPNFSKLLFQQPITLTTSNFKA